MKTVFPVENFIPKYSPSKPHIRYTAWIWWSRVTIHNIYPGFSGLYFTGNFHVLKLNKKYTKKEKITGVQYFCAYQQVVSTLSYHLSSIHFTFSQLAPNSLFSSTFSRVCHHPRPSRHTHIPLLTLQNILRLIRWFEAASFVGRSNPGNRYETIVWIQPSLL